MDCQRDCTRLRAARHPSRRWRRRAASGSAASRAGRCSTRSCRCGRARRGSSVKGSARSSCALGAGRGGRLVGWRGRDTLSWLFVAQRLTAGDVLSRYTCRQVDKMFSDRCYVCGAHACCRSRTTQTRQPSCHHQQSTCWARCTHNLMMHTSINRKSEAPAPR